MRGISIGTKALMEQRSAQLPAASRGRRHPYPACIGRLYEATFPDHCIEQRQCPRSQVAFVAAKAHHHSLICQYTSGQGVLLSWSINQGSVTASARSGLKDTMYFDVIIVPQLFPQQTMGDTVGCRHVENPACQLSGSVASA